MKFIFQTVPNNSYLSTNKAYCLKRIEKRESVMERHEIHDINVHDIQINKVDILKSGTYIEL